MSKKIISLFLLSFILLSGCSNSKPATNKTSLVPAITTTNTSTNISSEMKKSDQSTSPNSSNNATASKSINIQNKAVTAPLTSIEKSKVDNSVNSVVDSIDNALNSLDDAKELNLN